MKRNKRLDPIIAQAVRASFKDSKLMEPQVKKLLDTFKKLPKTEGIYLTSGYLKGVKREIAKSTLIVESAIPLTDQEMDQIKKKLIDGKIVNHQSLIVNQTLIGGLKVRVSDMVYDYSVKERIQQVKEVLVR